MPRTSHEESQDAMQAVLKLAREYRIGPKRIRALCRSGGLRHSAMDEAFMRRHYAPNPDSDT
jgi:hypothetical protein